MTILVPVILVLTGVRLMMSSMFLKLEYNLPGFPADRYGFTTADRLYWARHRRGLPGKYGRDRVSWADLRFEDGSPGLQRARVEVTWWM